MRFFLVVIIKLVIISAEVFDEVQEEISKRARFVRNEDGTSEASENRYNGKYLLGNLLVCGDCGVPYRRRMERGKVVWRCATRIEKGRQTCPNSPTLDEGWIQDTLGKAVCKNGSYDGSSVTDYIQIIEGGKLTKTTELLNGDIDNGGANIGAEASVGIGSVFKSLIGFGAKVQAESNLETSFRSEALIKTILQSTILTDFLDSASQ